MRPEQEGRPRHLPDLSRLAVVVEESGACVDGGGETMMSDEEMLRTWALRVVQAAAGATQRRIESGRDGPFVPSSGPNVDEVRRAYATLKIVGWP
jgi:hypothetical protein